MTTNIDEMTSEQLRDALAVAAGWKPSSVNGWVRLTENGLEGNRSPIPPLDSPDALGVVAGMMPSGVYFQVNRRIGSESVSSNKEWCCISLRPSSLDLGYQYDTMSFGPTETIARGKLVLKVLSATRKEGEVVKDCLVEGCDCQDAPPPS